MAWQRHGNFMATAWRRHGNGMANGSGLPAPPAYPPEFGIRRTPLMQRLESAEHENFDQRDDPRDDIDEPEDNRCVDDNAWDVRSEREGGAMDNRLRRSDCEYDSMLAPTGSSGNDSPPNEQPAKPPTAATGASSPSAIQIWAREPDASSRMD
jgi:hypothetical protein